MVRDPAASEDSPPLQVVLDALDDPDCRAILRETAEPMTATELLDASDIPRSTLYRKLTLLSDASLVREQYAINPGGGRTTTFERDFDALTISIDEDDDLSVAVERPPRNAEERLADIWSKMGEQL